MIGCIEIDVEGMPSFYTEKVVKARKMHKCVECHRGIKPGERYESAAGCWDDGFHVMKTCADCLSVRNAMFCSGWMYGEIWNEVREHLYYVDDLDLETTNQLTSNALERVLRIINGHKRWKRKL